MGSYTMHLLLFLALFLLLLTISKQWREVLRTANSLSKLERNYGTGFTFGAAAGPKIPLYAVGYSGWKDLATVEKHLKESEFVSGILVIENGHFSGTYKYIEKDKHGKAQEKEFQYRSESSAMALWGLISCVHFGGSMVTSTTKYVPKSYDSG